MGLVFFFFFFVGVQEKRNIYITNKKKKKKVVIGIWSHSLIVRLSSVLPMCAHTLSREGKGNGIYVSISKYGSDTPVTRPEIDKAGLSSRDRKRGGGKLKWYWKFEYSWEAWVDY